MRLRRVHRYAARLSRWINAFPYGDLRVTPRLASERDAVTLHAAASVAAPSPRLRVSLFTVSAAHKAAQNITLALVVLACVAPACAQDMSTDITLSRGDAAVCQVAVTRVPLLESKVAALESDLALKDRQLAAYATLQSLDEQIIGKAQKLQALAEQERDVYKDKSERQERSAKWTSCKAFAISGATVGGIVGSAAMGVGALPGAGLGAILGCLAGWLGL